MTFQKIPGQRSKWWPRLFISFFPVTLIQCGLLEEIDARKIKDERREREAMIQLLGQKKKVYLKYSKIGDWERIRDEKTREGAVLGSSPAHTQFRRRGCCLRNGVLKPELLLL